MKELPSPPAAVALCYDGTGAPRVTAKGEGVAAEQIVAVAKAHGIPLYQDEQLALLLSRLGLGDEVPRMLYLAVAQVIAFAYWVSGKPDERR